MMTKSKIAYDPYNDITQYMHYDDITHETIFESVGDAAPVLELNRRIANENDIWKNGVKNEFALYARIPTIFQFKLLAEKGIDVYKKEHGARLSQVLEDPEYRHLKCTNKRHIISAHD